MWIPTSDLPRRAAHPFYRRLNRILDEAGFDAFVEAQCTKFYAPVLGRPSLAPGRYVRLLLLGYFEGRDSERAIAWRAADSLSVRLARRVRGRSGRPGSLLTLAPHRSGRAGSAASGSSTDGFATRRRVPAGPGSQAMATAIPKAYLASSAIRCRDVETGPNLGVLAVFPSTGATCRCPLPSTGSRGLNSPASAVL